MTAGGWDTWEWRDCIKKKKGLMDMDNSVVIVGGVI